MDKTLQDKCILNCGLVLLTSIVMASIDFLFSFNLSPPLLLNPLFVFRFLITKSYSDSRSLLEGGRGVKKKSPLLYRPAPKNTPGGKISLNNPKGGRVPARRRSAEVKETRRKPATTPEARENELVSLAHDVAEKQMRDGSASSQVITHFLKAGSIRERLEHERLISENELAKAKIDAIESAKRVEELYGEAIKAMRSYAGDIDDDDPNVED